MLSDNWLLIGAGFVLSLGVAAVAVPRILAWLRKDFEEEARRLSPDVSGALIGSIERLFFTVAVAFTMNGAVIAMMIWITAKMAANWNSRANELEKIQSLRITALLGSVLSMLFALGGGLIARAGLAY